VCACRKMSPVGGRKWKKRGWDDGWRGVLARRAHDIHASRWRAALERRQTTPDGELEGLGTMEMAVDYPGVRGGKQTFWGRVEGGVRTLSGGQRANRALLVNKGK